MLDAQKPSPTPMETGAADRTTPRSRPRGGLPRLVWPVAALAALLLYNAVFTPGFLRVSVGEGARAGQLSGSLINIIERAAPVMMVGLGMTLVIATGGVDLAVGAVMAIAGAVAAVMLIEQEQPLAVALLVSLGVCLAAGIWNGALVAVVGIQPIVATLILMVAGRGIAQLLTGGQVPNTERFAGFAYLGGGYFFGLPFSLTLVAVMFIVTAGLTRLTALGLFVEASGNNPSAARHAGVNVTFVKTFVYTFTGVCAGVAGLVATADINAADANQIGLYLELDAILAVVLGGTALAGGRFSLAGTMVGALIIQTLTATLYYQDVRPVYNNVVKALVVLAVCLMQSEELRRRVLGWRGRGRRR